MINDEQFKNAIKSKKGQGLVEYGLIIGIVAVAILALLSNTGTRLQALLQPIITALTGVAQ